MMENDNKFVVCINNDEYPASLELHKIYRTLPDPDAEQDGDLRIIDESGEDFLFPAEWFVLIDLPHAVEESLMNSLISFSSWIVFAVCASSSCIFSRGSPARTSFS